MEFLNIPSAPSINLQGNGKGGPGGGEWSGVKDFSQT